MNGKHNYWRLPTISELQNIFDYEKGKPKIKSFSWDHYWSSTTFAGYNPYAWYVYFRNGYSDSHSKTKKSYARCVRTTKKGKLKWSKTSDKTMTWDEAIAYAKQLEE